MSQGSQPSLHQTGTAADDWYEALKIVRPLLVVISGPSGVGKDATINRMKERGYPCHFVVTMTTRPKRPAEVDGVDYHFVSEETFTEMIARGELLEHAMVYGQYKGIPKADVEAALASGRDVVMRLDVQGAATVRRMVPQVVTVFLTAESEPALVERLRRRHTEDEEQLQRRVETARAELQRAADFQYRVVNCECELDRTVDQIIAIMQSEKCRVDWERVTL